MAMPSCLYGWCRTVRTHWLPARAPARSRGSSCRGSAARLELLDLPDQLGDRLLPLGDHAVVGDLEDRLVLVLVDRDDRLAALHAREVLDRTGDRDREVQVRRDDLAGLTDLPVGGDHAGVGRGARSAHRGTEQIGELLEDLEVLAALHAAAAGDDDLGIAEVGTIALLRVEALERGAEGIELAGGSRRDRARAAELGSRL